MMNIIKQWILNRQFVIDSFEAQLIKKTEEVQQYERTKGFALAQRDILETMTDDLDEKAEELAKIKLTNLLSNVDLTKVVTVDRLKGLLYIDGNRPDDVRMANLKAEAEFILNSDIWTLLCETPKELAQKAMFRDDGKIETQLLKGRAILYTLDSQKIILNTFISYQQKKS